MATFDKEALVSLIARDALEYGDFTLASGARSHFYIDCRKVTLSAAGAALVGAGMLAVAEELGLDAVGGLTMGADPVVGATLAAAGAAGRPLRGFLVRKEAKLHGLGNLVEGPLRAGDRVLVVEDVTTTGGSAAKAIEAARAIGAEVIAVATVLDRAAGAAALFAGMGLAFRPLANLADLDVRPAP